jgi:hypothetical protein
MKTNPNNKVKVTMKTDPKSSQTDDDRSFVINVSQANNLNLPLVISFLRNIAERWNNNICFILSQFARGNKLNAHNNHFGKKLPLLTIEENIDTLKLFSVHLSRKEPNTIRD